MQTNFQVQWVPLPAEREGEWRHAIELIAQTIKEYAMTMNLKSTNKYRFAWIDPKKDGTQYGSYLFNTPEEAAPSANAMQMMFCDFIIWLEDREHNRVEMPR